jgi:hypothetical protein
MRSGIFTTEITEDTEKKAGIQKAKIRIEF